MALLQDLYETRAETAKEIRRLADRMNSEPETWSPEDEKQWDDANADYNAQTARIEKLERAESVERAQAIVDPTEGGTRDVYRFGDDDNEPTPSVTTSGGPAPERRSPYERWRDASGAASSEERAYNQAMGIQAWARVQAGMDITEEHRECSRRARINPSAKFLDINLRQDYRQVRREFRDIAVSSEPEVIPEGFVSSLERSLLAFGGMRQVADVIRTASGNDLPWPTADDTGNTGELLTEAGAIGTSVDPTIGEVIFQAFKYSSKLVKVSSELLQDSAFDLASVLGSMLGERLGRIQNTHFTTGDASSKPNGIVTAATKVNASTSTAIVADDLITLFHSVDVAYRTSPRWMCHDLIVAELRKLTDGNSQYMWQPGLQQGVPDLLLGYPVTVNNDMVSTTANGDDNLIFGDLTKYKIRDAGTIRLRRLVELYAGNDQEGFVAFHRSDGDLLDAGTDPLKCLQMIA